MNRIYCLMAIVLLCLFTKPTFAADPPAPVYRTGQTAQWEGFDDGGVMSGAFVWPGSRFNIAADGTVEDNLTGLIWARAANMPTVGSCAGGGKTWQEALNYVACLNTQNYLGHNDWILPNLNELKSLVDMGRTNPSLPVGHPFTDVISGFYWSSTASYSVTQSWGVSMALGKTNWNSNSLSSLVWPVRAQKLASSTISLPRTSQTVSYAAGDDGALKRGVAWPSPRFTDNLDGSITDNLTGLVWLKNADCYPGLITWSQALQAAMNQGNGVCGYTGTDHDWRLPNREEFESLYDRLRDPSLPAGHPFTNLASAIYWTSSTHPTDSSQAWCAYTYTGSVGNEAKVNGLRFMAVRGGQISRVTQARRIGAGTGSITANTGPINWPISWDNYGELKVPYGASVTYTATADPGSIFTGWTVSSGCSGTGTCTQTVYYNWLNTGGVTADFSIDPTDTDGDGVRDGIDNCRLVVNPDQADFNHNAVGDLCEDSDNDGLTDAQEIADGTSPLNPDRTPPVALFLSVPLSVSNQTSGSITFNANESATFTCQLDGGAYSACTSPFSYSSLTNGPHTLSVIAKDGAGNLSAPVTTNWTVNVPLFTTIPPGNSNQASGSFTFTANETATFKCSLDGGTFDNCTSPFNYSTLANGQHTLSVKSIDGMLNVSPTTTYTWVINTALLTGFSVLLPQTGQLTCWGSDGNYTACSGTGQDADKKTGVPSPDPRFTDNGNGTVTDNLTGLIWTKNATCLATRPWADALAATNTLASGTCGLADGSVAGDWRLPNVNELESLLDYQNGGSGLPAGHPFTNMSSWGYWTSTTKVKYPSSAWGWPATAMTYDSWSFDKMTALGVWPVRSGQ